MFYYSKWGARPWTRSDVKPDVLHSATRSGVPQRPWLCHLHLCISHSTLHGVMSWAFATQSLWFSMLPFVCFLSWKRRQGRQRFSGTLSGHKIQLKVSCTWKIAGCICNSTWSFDSRMGPSTAGQGHQVLSCPIKLMVMFQPLLPGVQNSHSPPFSWGQFGC